MSASVLIWMISSFRWEIWFKVIFFFLNRAECMGIVVFIVCCHFISLYYLPREGPLLLLQAVQKALPRFFFHFAKIIIFSENLSFFCCFFFFFAPMFVAFAVMFVAFASMILLSYSSFECLPPASFRFHLAVDTLAIGYTIPAIRAC